MDCESVRIPKPCGKGPVHYPSGLAPFRKLVHRLRSLEEFLGRCSKICHLGVSRGLAKAPANQGGSKIEKVHVVHGHLKRWKVTDDRQSHHVWESLNP